MGPHCFDRKTSMPVPAVFAVLIKMNLYLCEMIIAQGRRRLETQPNLSDDW